MVTRSAFHLSLLFSIAGIGIGSAWPTLLPVARLLALLAAAAFFLLLYRVYRRHAWLWCACLLTGFAWSQQHGHTVLDRRLPESLAGVDMQVRVLVINLPERTERGRRFDVQVLDRPGLRRLRLNVYGEAFFQPGECWQLQVRLKPPRGFVNAGGFDYEGWLFEQGYSATGYVRSPETASHLQACKLSPGLQLRQRFDRWAFVSLRWMEQHVQPQHQALFAATALGYKDGFTRAQWDQLRDTGTIHLVVVSGLHIVLMAAAGYGVMAVLVRALVFPLRFAPAPLWSASGAMLTASFYAGMSGFSLPTQRALIMVLCGLLALLLRRRMAVLTGFLLAMLVVVALDPLAFFSASFWLSFGAVAVLLYAFAARMVRRSRWQWLSLAIKTQFVVSIGLVPLLAGWMGSVPLIMPFANLIAVPWITFIVTPLVILSALMAMVSEHVSSWLLMLCDTSMDGFWHYIAVMQGLNKTLFISQSIFPFWLVMLLSGLGMALLLAPAGSIASRTQQWFLGGLMLLPLLLPATNRVPDGEFRLRVLDVGQGLAVLVETAEHILVYDTGDKFSDQFDIGRDLVAQQVRLHGYREVDRLVVSHADSDHAGGMAGLLSALPVRGLFSGNAEILRERTPVSVQECVSGQQWRFNGVEFRVLSPAAAVSISKRNNRSCVVEVRNRHFSVLLTGDIEAVQEQWLVDTGLLQAVDVLLLPHHGSKTSSSWPFLQALDPELAIVSVGYRSQYGHPHPLVQARYRELGIPLARTDHDGALVLDSVTGIAGLKRARQESGRYWHGW